MTNNQHLSVMLDESIKALNIKSDGVYIDTTFGRGGHSKEILDKLGKSGSVIAFDKDISAIDYAKKNIKDDRLEVIHNDFANMKNIILERKLIGKIDGILMDLGVSSPQLDNANRGFSFNKDGALDMRMDQNTGLSVANWLQIADENEIADVVYRFGEEKKSRQIASGIKKYQQHKPIKTTLQLADIISGVIKKYNRKHPATRTFQALRIFINQELDSLEQALEQSLELLKPSGRLVVISFHSLEDRIVKKFIKKHSQQKILPKGLPIKNEKIEKTILTNLGKFFASKDEINNNNRSRSAILRVASKNDKNI